MGNYAEAWLPNNLPLSFLSSLTNELNRDRSALKAVASYWNQRAPGAQSTELLWKETWREDWLVTRDIEDVVREGDFYCECGTCRLLVYQNVVRLQASCRWLGFVSIKEMRDIYHGVALHLGRVMKSHSVVWLPEYHESAFDDDPSLTFDQITSSLQEKWGSKRRIDEMNILDHKDKAEKSQIWFLEACS